MSICKKCGTEIEDNAKFCPKCGTPNLTEFSKKEDKQKLGKLEIISIVSIGICALFAIFKFAYIKNFADFLAGLITLIQIGVFLSYLLLNRQIIKTNKIYLKTIFIISGFVLVIPFTLLSNAKTDSHSSSDFSYTTEPETYDTYIWPDGELAKKLPEPESKIGKVVHDSYSSLYVKVSETTLEQYNSYISKCREEGFNVNYDKTDFYYYAENSEGYTLSVSFDDEKGLMSIDLSEPIEETTAASTIEKPTEKDTEETTEKEIFPLENAKRAAVVALNNAYSWDIYGDDENTIDKSKLHTYADLSGNYILVDSWGDWKEKDSDTWHVDNFKGTNDTDTSIEASLDVSYDGKNYIVSNITGSLGMVELSEIERTRSDKDVFLTVSPKLIKDDRNTEKKDKEKQKTSEAKAALNMFTAQDAFDNYGKKMYPYGFKSHWFLNSIASEQRDDGSWFFKVGVTVTNAFNVKQETVAEGIVSGTDDNPNVESFLIY